MVLLDRLPHTVDILVRERSVDSFGGERIDWKVEREGVSCWVMPLSDKEIEIASRRGIEVSCKVYFSENPFLTEENVLRYGDHILEVVSFSYPDVSAGLGKLFCVYARM